MGLLSSESVTHRRGGPNSFWKVPSYHSTMAPLTPLALRRVRISGETSCAFLVVVVVG